MKTAIKIPLVVGAQEAAVLDSQSRIAGLAVQPVA